MKKPNLRIHPLIVALMIVVALVYDGLKALLEFLTLGLLSWLFNPLINIWAQLTFLFWFTYLGVRFFKPGKMLGIKLTAISVPSIVGLFPWIGSLPFWTSGVIINLAAVYAEDMLETVSPEALQKIGQGLKKLKQT